MLATILPGLVSTMCKVVSPQTSARGGKGVHGDVVQAALGILREVIIGCFGPQVEVEGGAKEAALESLDELNGWVEEEDGEGGWTASRPPQHSDSPMSAHSTAPSSPAPSTPGASRSALPPRPSPSSFLVTLTASWQSATAAQILPAIVSLSHLKTHSNPLAREALADFSSALLEGCLAPLESSAPVLVGMLLTLSVDDFPVVQQRAQRGLNDVLSSERKRPTLLPIIKAHLLSSFNTIPLLLQSPHQASSQKVLDLSLQITAVSLLPSSASLLQGLLGPLGGVQRWGSGFLDCLEFERAVVGESDAGSSQRVAELAWTGAASESTINPDALHTSYPALSLRNIPNPRTKRAFEDMLFSLGRAGGVDALFTVEYFASVANNSSTRRGLAALWCAGRILEGATEAIRKAEETGGQIGEKQRRLRKVARDLVRCLVELGEDENEEDREAPLDSAETDAHDSISDALLPTEYSKGIDALTTLLDRPGPSTTSSKRTYAAVQRPLLTCLSLALIAQSASILSSSFRPLLLNSLYYLLSHLGSPYALVRTYAEVALTRVAYHVGYASPQNLVMDNVDYVINVVSQRLTSERLSQAAPLVLISMIRLVGEPIVPLVHDIVDEIFDALDDFHGYETICSTLLAVLDTLMKVMATEVTSSRVEQGKTVDPTEPSSSRFHAPQPSPDKDLANFKQWFAHRHDAAKEDLSDLLSDNLPEPTPHKPWGAPKGDPSTEHEVDPPSGLRDADIEPPKPTRAQVVCAQILSKALFFLTHGSAFIRARVLSLFSSAIAVLGPSGLEAELLPVVNKAWPYILNRLSGPDEPPFVVVEAARVLESLAEHVGDFVSSRIRDEGWPTLRRLLVAQIERDVRAAKIVRRPGARGDNPVAGASTGRHSTTHRLYRSILFTIVWVSSSTPVPAATRWEMALAARVFLGEGVEEELRRAARDVFVSLGRVEEDMVWAMLNATVGKQSEPVDAGVERMGWLREEGWLIEGGVSEVLEILAKRR